MASSSSAASIRPIATAIIAVAAVVAGLIYGRSFLLPIVIAFLAASLLDGFVAWGLRIGLPTWLGTIIGISLFPLFTLLVYGVLLSQVDLIYEVWPHYVQRFEAVLAGLLDWLGKDTETRVRDFLGQIDLTRQVTRQLTLIAGSAAGIMLNVLLVLIYFGFLVAERGALAVKIKRLAPNEEEAKRWLTMAWSISQGIRHYLWVKTVMSVLTAAISYIVLKIIGVDFAETWALLVFFLNYIPNIGSVLGVVFPALLSLVQFETVWQFFVVGGFLASAQFAIGNIVEPIFMGRTLNISIFAVMVALMFWATIWGVAGMFLSVPITVALMIVCANIPALRWIAVMLSSDGHVDLPKPPDGGDHRALR